MNTTYCVNGHHCHHWSLQQLPTDGVVKAHCMRKGCHARQYQPVEVSEEAVLRANSLNRKHGYPLILVSVKSLYRIRNGENLLMTFESEKTPFISTKGGRPPSMCYDAIAGTVIALARRVGWYAAARKHKIPRGSIGTLARRWEEKGLVEHLSKRGKRTDLVGVQ